MLVKAFVGFVVTGRLLGIASCRLTVIYFFVGIFIGIAVGLRIYKASRRGNGRSTFYYSSFLFIHISIFICKFSCWEIDSIRMYSQLLLIRFNAWLWKLMSLVLSSILSSILMMGRIVADQFRLLNTSFLCNWDEAFAICIFGLIAWINYLFPHISNIVNILFDNSPLLLNMLLIATSRLWLLPPTLTRHHMEVIIFVSDGQIAFRARFGTRLTCFKMSRIRVHWYIEIAVLAILGLLVAIILMGFVLFRREGQAAVWTFLLFVILLFVLLFEVDVVHFSTVWTLLDVPTAIAVVGGHLALGEVFQTIVTSLQSLILHLFYFKLLLQSYHLPPLLLNKNKETKALNNTLLYDSKPKQ